MVEYLEGEYMNNFEDEISENISEAADESAEIHDKSNSTKTKPDEPAKNRRKRTYPFKCKKCNKRFVYKEVYEAHIRIHKGLPGFS